MSLNVVGELAAVQLAAPPASDDEDRSVFCEPSLIVPTILSRNIGAVVVPLPRP